MPMQFIVDQMSGQKPKRRPPMPGVGRKRKEMKISMDELRRLYESGMPWSKIQDIAGLPHSLLRYRLQTAGVELVRPSRHTKEKL